MIRVRWALAFVAAGAPVLRASAGPDQDEERSSWRYRRSVTVAAPASGSGLAFAALALPPELLGRCQADLRDLRLVEGDGREVPYVIDRLRERGVTRQWSGHLIDTRQERKVQTAYVVDLLESRSFDEIVLDVREQDFAKRMRVEASDDLTAWRVLREDAGIFDRSWNVRVHHTTVALPQRVTARYLRLTGDDRRSRPLLVQGVTVLATRRVAGEEWRRPASLKPIRTAGGVSRYRLDLESALPFDALELTSDDPAFSRRVALYEAHETNGRREEAVLGERSLYRLKLEDEALSGEALSLSLRPPRGGELILEVQDGDSPPLRNPRVLLSSVAARLLFPNLGGPLTLYYGNGITRAPLYDLESLKWRLGVNTAFAAAGALDEAENPRYRKAAPLSFAPARGQTLEATRFKAHRELSITGAEDLYTLTLAANDLGMARPDLGDLRVVDDADRQVPFILEPAAAEARVDLEMERVAERWAGRAITRRRLSILDPVSRKPLALPISALELSVREGFFTRPVRLLVPPPLGSRGGERVAFAGVLAQAGDRGQITSRDARMEREPIVLGLANERVSELFLEIDEGDNAPLTLLRLRGVVRVPRIAFKAGPGRYRVLMGNSELPAPRYDIASLRQEVLAYSAVVVQAGPIQPNPSYRRSAGDYFKDAPPTAILWGTLVGAVVVLLLLTARILRQPASG